MTDALAQGILLGGLYASVALRLSIVFGVLRLVNLGHGELLVGAAFLSFVVIGAVDVDPILSLVVVAPAMMLVAYPLQRYVLTPVLTRNQEAPLVATFGLSLAATGIFAQAAGSDPRSLEASWSSSGLSVLGVHVRTAYLLAFLAGVLLVAATHLVLTRTRTGAAVRAAAADPETAASMGIDVRRLYALTFAAAAAMAAVGGVFIGVAFSFTPTSGLGWLLTGFAVVVLGGIGSVSGTLLGGLAVGIVEAVGIEAFGGAWRDLIVYGLFFLALAIRPMGLFGKSAA